MVQAAAGHVRGAIKAALCLSVWASGAAQAQGVLAPPRQEVEAPTTTAPTPPPQVDVQSEGAMAAAPCSLANSPLTVRLQSIRYEASGGGEVSAELRPLLAPLAAEESGEQPISVVCRIRDRLDAALAEAGYVARIQVPAQQITKGELRLVVVSARIVDVQVKGDFGRFARQLQPRLEAIRALSPFNQKAAVDILLGANDIPGLQVRMGLRSAAGRSGDLIADVEANISRYTVSLNAQNYGSHQIGREAATIRADFNGLTGFGDHSYLALSNTAQWHESHIVQAGHDFALGHGGTRLALRVSAARANPDIPTLPLTAGSLIGAVELSTPLLRRIAGHAQTSVGLELLNQTVQLKSGGAELPFTRDRTRVAFAKLTGAYNAFQPGGGLTFHLDGQLEARRGLAIFSATQAGGMDAEGYLPSHLHGDSQAFVLRGELSTTSALADGLWLDAKAFGQYANHPLLNLEQMAIGSFTYGRGYDPGANSGDEALAFRLEPHARLARLGPVEVEGSGFFDWVKLHNLDPSAGAEVDRELRSVGGGLRLVLPGEAQIDVLYAQPLDKALMANAARPPARLLVSLTTKILPWSAQ